MYKLKRPTNRQLADFYDAYGPRIQYLMQELASGNITIQTKLGSKYYVFLTQKVQANSETWKFLVKYSQEANLRKLLCGDWNCHFNIIKEVCQSFPGRSWQEKMEKGKYKAGKYATYGQDADGNEIVEDFNEIIYWLFVTQMFEGKDDVSPFIKKDFVIERGLEVCPYCGLKPIDVAEVNGSISKPYIDHFMPKRKYPFLAMSYMNLIPACQFCNEDENKGDYDPLLYPNYEMRLVNPYEFYDKVVTFGYEYNYQGENDEKNFKVLSEAENDNLEDGYLIKLKLRKFYSHRSWEVKDLYRRFTKSTNSFKKFLYRLGINKNYLYDLEETTLGHSPNEDYAHREPGYKFHKDLLAQLKREYGI